MNTLSLQLTSPDGRKVTVKVEPNRTRSRDRLPYIMKSRNSDFMNDLIETSNLDLEVNVGNRHSYVFVDVASLNALMSNLLPEPEVVPSTERNSTERNSTERNSDDLLEAIDAGIEDPVAAMAADLPFD